MTSKERIRAAIAHQETDRVPSTMQCVETAWEKLKAHFGVETIDEVQDILEIDTRIMDLPPYIGPEHPPHCQRTRRDRVYPPLWRLPLYQQVERRGVQLAHGLLSAGAY